ncbi:Protein psi1 [Diplonema papillatum]|nr:Protein psi1 [Diplonema papillatum]KAJ9461068.1 Protein psi1 [Diplonema papillatum]
MGDSGFASRVFGLTDSTALYDVLECSPSATQDEIKRAFRRLAVRYHPDKNPHGEEKFQELSFAYRILSNEDERRLYDASKLRPSEGRDPRMNPDVELEGDALRDFISSLVREEEASAERRKNFASRKQTELDRRRQFDRENPGFRMPSIPAAAQVESTAAALMLKASHTDAHETAGSLAAGRSASQNHNFFFARSKPSSVYHDAPSTANGQRPSPFRRQYANAYGPHHSGSRPETSPAPPPYTTSPTPAPTANAFDAWWRTSCAAQKAPLGTKEACARSFEALVKAEKCRKVYEGDVDKIHQKAQAFDYKSYVEEHKHADLLNDAILSDALREYTKW